MGGKWMYDSNIFARSFNRYDQNKLRYGAFLGCLLVALSFSTVFKLHLSPFPVLYTKLSMVVESNISTNQTIINENVISSKTPVEPICHFEKRTEFCQMNGDVRVDGKSSTVFMSSATNRAGTSVPNGSWIIRPYARRGDESAMKTIREWSIKSGVDAYDAPQCDQTHGVPAIIFSLKGYTGNNFHDFADVMVPLYLTCRRFDGEVKFLITKRNQWWINKFRRLLQKLSRYEPIDIDKEVKVHCFKSVTIGLKRYAEDMKLDDPNSASPYSMRDFRQVLRSAYSLKKESAIRLRDDNGGKIKRPRLLIISRRRSRSFTNIDEITQTAIGLGYDVVTIEPNASTSLGNVAQTVNSCDVLMGVHGAGLTNMVFLPDNAIVIQIVPFGSIDGLARVYFEEPSKDMKLRYLGYKIKAKESSLMGYHKVDDPIIKDPLSIQKHGWHAVWSIYLNKQNVKLDVNRFRSTLLKALELLHHDDQ